MRIVAILACVVASIGLSKAAADDLPQLNAATLKVGASYKTDGGERISGAPGNTWAKIITVIDDDSMLVGIDHGATVDGSPRYGVRVMCKSSTKNLNDGDDGFLSKFIGATEVSVSGTTKVKTAAGGQRTVFVLEAMKKK